MCSHILLISDSDSETVVQEAIDTLMKSTDHSIIVIAHRLSTIRHADRIALISGGKVLEFGSHDELIQKPHGRYKRLVESSKRRSTVDSVGLRRSALIDEESRVIDDDEEEEQAIDWEAKISEEEAQAFNAKRARQMAKPDAKYMIIGSVGALLAGSIFPAWGIIFRYMIRCRGLD